MKLNAATAPCPRRGSESAVGDKSDDTIDTACLGSMNEAWFQRTMIICKPGAKK